MSFTLGDAIKRKNNNFDVIRLVASLAVIFGHSFDVFLTDGHQEPLKRVLVNDYSGSIAVYVFFFLSGIFIASSFVNSTSVVRFVLMRVFRIWPGLIVCILITVFIVGPIFTVYSLHNYFTDFNSWNYLLKNFLMFRFEPRIPSVFPNNHFIKALNGSLWTLPMEINCYMIVLILGVIGVFKRKTTVVIATVSIVLLNHYVTSLDDVLFITKATKFFFAGMMCFMFRDYIILNRKFAVCLMLAACVLYIAYFKVFSPVFYAALLYVMVIIGISETIKKIKLPGDYSYGIYIYGFLIQQIIAHLFPEIKAYPSMLVTVPLSVIAGVFSWHFIELPAIKKGKELSKKF